MKKSRSLKNALAAGVVMLTLILDSATAISGAYEGILICLQTVVPSLFPFFVLSSMLTGFFSGSKLSFLYPLRKALGLPEGSESIFLTGILGGYPVGASCISAAYRNGTLSHRDAERMLGFCNNAGPAFIFGMASVCFPSLVYPCLLMLIHIFSALLTGILTRQEPELKAHPEKSTFITWSDAMHRALRSTGIVCGWIIMFRVILDVFERWFLWLFPSCIQVILTGILELSNGVLSLDRIVPIPLRFILCSGMLSFGGICVAMQIQAVTEGLSIRPYLQGKLLQCILSTGLSAIACCFLFAFDTIYLCIAAICCTIILLVFLLLHKKTVALSAHLMYNARKKINAR